MVWGAASSRGQHRPRRVEEPDMTTQSTAPGDTFAKKIAIAAAASVLGGLIGTLLLPGIGTALGLKLGGIFGGGSAS